jgi:hypothetical protein
LRKQLQTKINNLTNGITELTQVLKPKQVDFKLPDTICISIICFFGSGANWHRLLFLVNISIILKYLCQNQFFSGHADLMTSLFLLCLFYLSLLLHDEKTTKATGIFFRQNS